MKPVTLSMDKKVALLNLYQTCPFDPLSLSVARTLMFSVPGGDFSSR